MQKILSQYSSWLKNERGFTRETIEKYVSNLKIMFRQMRIYDISLVNDIVLNKRLLDQFWVDVQGERPLADSTRSTYLSSLKSFCSYLYQQNLIQEDIAPKIQMPKKRLRYIRGSLSQEDQKKLRAYLAQNLKTERELRDAALVMFLWATGCRVSEALALRCHPDSYIYYHDARLISGDFHVEDGKVYAHIMGKGKRDRVIRVADEAVAYCNLYLSNREKKNAILFQNYRNYKNDERRLKRGGAAHVIKMVLERAGINKEIGVCTHILRHTAINNWLEKGYNDMQVITMSGHSGPEGLKPYHLRNYKATDPFGEADQATGQLEDSRLQQLEKLILERHTLKR